MKRVIGLTLLCILLLALAAYFEDRATWLAHMLISVTGAISWNLINTSREKR